MAQKGTNAAVVGGNNDEIIALDGTDSIIGRQYSDHPQYQPLVAALKSRSYGGNLTKKKEVLLQFRLSELDDVERFCRDLWMSHGCYLFDTIRIKSTKDIAKNLKMDYVAESLAELYVLNQWIKKLPPTTERNLHERRGTDPMEKTKKAFASLTRYVGPILKKYQEDQAKKTSTKSKVNLQQTGTRIQDTVPFDPDYLDAEGCPNCNHFYCQPVNTEEEVRTEQRQKDNAFAIRLSTWQAKPVKERGAKPRRSQSVCQNMGCYCVRMHCGMRLDGGNCPMCRAAATAGNSMVLVDGRCQCEICSCKCKIVFPVHKRREVKLEMEELKRATEGSSSSTPTDTPSFFHQVIQDTLQQNTIDAAQESTDPTMVHRNALSLATNDVFSNPLLQSVSLRNNMQKAVPRTTMTANGLSINQLRKRQKAGLVTPSTGNSALAMKGIEREQRFNSNRLSVDPIVPPSVAARPTHSISTLDDDSDEIQCLGSNQIPVPGSSEGDMKRKATEPVDRPAIIKRIRKKANRTLRQEMKKSEQDDLTISKLKTTIDQLSSPNITKKTEEYFVDNEEDFSCSQEMVEISDLRNRRLTSDGRIKCILQENPLKR